jgi:PKD repeat protein
VKVDVFNADCDSEKQTCFKVDVIANPTVTFNGDAGTKAGAQGVEGTPTTVTGSFTVDPRAENVCLTVNYHDGTGEHRLSYDPSNNTFSITLPAGEEGDYPLTVTVRADDQSASADTTVHVQEAAWTISKFSNQQLDLGQTLPGLNGKVNDVSVDLPAHAYVNFGDGSATQEVDTNASGQYTLPAHVYAAAGTYNVQVVVDNADSDSEKQTCFKVDVIANPTVTFNGDAGTAAGAQGTEGSPTTVTGSFTVDPRAENVCLTVNYHDGTGEHPLAYNPANDTFSITLPAGEEGDYPLTVTVHADDQSASADTTVHVEEAPWTITTFSNQELTLGQSLSGLSGKVNDVSVDLPAHVYVNFGDGTPVVSVQTDNNGNYVLPNHTYGASGQFNVTITVFNQDGDSSKTTGFEVTVSKAPTTPYLPPNSLIITILIGNQPHQPFFCWPGQVHTPPVCPITTFYIQPAAQLYQSGPSGWDNHPPEVYFDFQDGQDHTVVEIDEGEQLHQKGHLYDMDGDPLIGFYKIDDEAGWRALPLQGDNRSFTLDLDLPVGEHRITVKAIDPYGAEGWKTLRVIVKEVSLSCDVNPETKLATGAEYQPTGVANYTGHRKLTGTIDYGDGTTVELKDVPANKQFKLPVHKYAKPGVYKVKLTVTDGRKTATSTLKKVEVQDAPVGAAFPVDDDGLVEFTSASAFNLNGVLGEDGDDMQLFYAALAGIALTGPVLTVADRYFAAVGEGKEELKDPRLKLPEVL